MRLTFSSHTATTAPPKGVTPNLIGSVVRLQLVAKDTGGPQEHVGILMSYTTSPASFTYQLKGRELEVIDYSKFEVVEMMGYQVQPEAEYQ